MKAYKLTTQDNKTRKGTYNETTWEVGKRRTTNGEGELCGPGWLHFYQTPEIALLMNPIQACIQNPKLWEIETGSRIKHEGLKVGSTEITLIREIKFIEPTVEQYITFAILCAKEVSEDIAWHSWADDWLSGKDRSKAAAAYTANAAYTAYDAAYAAAYAAAYVANAAYAAAYAAYAAAYAAYATANAVERIFNIAHQVLAENKFELEELGE